MKNKILAAAVLLLALLGCKEEKQNLYVYTWADYIDPELIQQFEKENDCRVVIDTFDCNESMLAKIMAGAKGYDILMPTEYIMPLLVDKDLIEPIDTNLIQNVIANFDKKFESEWSLKWNVPYAFSCTGILWRKDKCPADLEFKDWNDMFDQRLKGRICMMNDIREVIGLGLIMNKFSANSTNESEIAIAVETAKSWKSSCSKMDNEAYRTGISSGEFYVAMSYNSDAIQLIADGGENIGYSVPTNGTTSSIDVFCLMKGCKNKPLAHKFIDMFYIPENTVRNAEYNGVPMPVLGVYDMLSDEYKEIPFMQVTDELKSRCQDLRDVGDMLHLYAKAWDKIKAK